MSVLKEKHFLGLPIGVYLISAILLLALTHTLWLPLIIEEPAYEYLYTTGLTTKFKVMDDTTSALITANLKVEIFPSTVTEDLVYAKTFTTKPTTVASYDSVLGAWTASLDVGSYNVLLTDTQGTQTRYGDYTSITVSGTDDKDKETWATPSTLHVIERATETISKAIYAYNDTSESYDISASTINYTDYDKWEVTLTFRVAGDDKYLGAGRIYTTEITNLSPMKASLDGTEVSMLSDKDASDDSLIGYYAGYSTDWEGETVHTLVVYYEETATITAGTLTVTHADMYAVHRSALKWWTYYTTTITVEA